MDLNHEDGRASQKLQSGFLNLQTFGEHDMKTTLWTAVYISALAVGVSPVWADDTHHPEKTGAPTKAPAAKVKDKGAGMGNMPMMQEHMQQMQQQMDKILHSKDAAEKDALIQEHMQAMLEHMKMMQGMMSGGMTMGGGMPPQMLEQRLKMMEQRLDQMQTMLDKSRQPAEKK